MDFCIKEKGGSIRGVNSLEEFIKVFKEFEIPFEKAQMQQHKKKPRKLRIQYAKKQKQDFSNQIPPRREFQTKAEMVDTTRQKHHYDGLVSSYLWRTKVFADNIDNTNTVPTSFFIKQTKVYNTSDAGRTGRLISKLSQTLL